MKKVFLVAVAVFLAVAMVGCGKPVDMSQEAYDLGNEAVAIGDRYLSGDLSRSSAHDRLQAIYDDLDALISTEPKDSSVSTYVVLMKSWLLLGDEDKFEESLNNLKSTV